MIDAISKRFQMRFMIVSLLIIVSITHAAVTIDSSSSEITDFEVGYFIDDSKKLQFEDIKSIQFSKGKNSDSLGAKVTNSWIKIVLFNATDETQTLFLHQALAYAHVSMKYFEVDDTNTLLNTKEMNKYFAKEKMNMHGADSIYEFSLEPKQRKTIYINQKTHAYHFYDFSLRSQKESSQFLIYQKVDGVLFVGLLLALALYNLFIYFSSRYKEYLYYSLYILSATVWTFYMYGALAHYFEIYGIVSARFNFALMLTPVFLALFVQTIFETKIKYKTEHWFLHSIIALLSLNIIYGFINLNHSLQLLSLSLNYTLIVFMWISISIYKKGNKIIKIFLAAHTFYLLLNIYAILFYTGVAEFNYISSHAIGIGIVIEALILAYLVAYKFKVMEDEKRYSGLLLMQKTKMADMGEMVANIAHQWRQPLATISVGSGILREKKNLDRLSDKEFEEELNHIDSNIEHMSQTIDHFLTYFKPNKTQKEFSLLDAVQKALLLIGNTLYKHNIEVITQIDKELKLFGVKEELVQVLISIISNALFALKDQEKKTIQFISKQENQKIVLEIIDNAGGIKKELLAKIFEPYFSTKHHSDGTGLGLYISKNIIQNSMNGDITVENTKDGAKFSIIFTKSS